MYQKPIFLEEQTPGGKDTHPAFLSLPQKKVTSLAKDPLSPVFLQLLFKAPWWFFTVKLTGVLGF